MSALSTRGLRFSHPGGFCLGPIDLELQTGSCTALIGRSGAGKSTFLRCLAGLESPTTGSLTIRDKTVFDGRERVAAHARGIGFVFQGGALWPHLDAWEHLRFAAPARTESELEGLLDRVGLTDKQHRKPAELSGGEQQRLAIARALAPRPSLLLLDEPLRSLDVHLRAEIAILVRDLAAESNATLLSVTHDRDEALLLADDAVVLEAGRIVESGPIAVLEREPRTAHTAALLAGGTCWDVAIEPRAEMIDTPFGRIAMPQEFTGAMALAILPGDLRIADPNVSDGLPGTVIASEGIGFGANDALSRVHVAANTRRFVVVHDRPLRAGSRVLLVPTRPLRILPWSFEVKS